MDDLISRQAAIDALNVGAEFLRRVLDDVDVVGAEREKYSWGLGLVESCIADMKDLPSTQPERKKGKWVPHRERSREYIGTTLVSIRYDYWFCDSCGYRVEDGQPMYNFCPNCGAKMGGEEE